MSGTLLDHLNRRVLADLRAAIEKRDQAERDERTARFLVGPARVYRTTPRPSWEAFRWPCPSRSTLSKEQS